MKGKKRLKKNTEHGYVCKIELEMFNLKMPVIKPTHLLQKVSHKFDSKLFSSQF